MSSKTKGSKKLRDLIRVGVFSALWIAVGWIIGCTVGFFPPIMLALPCILAVFGALILVVMLSKITIRGGFLRSCSVSACFLWPPTALCLSALSLAALSVRFYMILWVKTITPVKLLVCSAPCLALRSVNTYRCAICRTLSRLFMQNGLPGTWQMPAWS